MSMLSKKINRYRTVKVRFCSFDFPVNNLQFHGFVKNDGVSKMKGLSVYNFDVISYLSTSENGFIHAVGLAGKQLYQIILKNGN